MFSVDQLPTERGFDVLGDGLQLLLSLSVDSKIESVVKELFDTALQAVAELLSILVRYLQLRVADGSFFLIDTQTCLHLGYLAAQSFHNGGAVYRNDMHGDV